MAFDYNQFETNQKAAGIRVLTANPPGFATTKYYELSRSGVPISFTNDEIRAARDFIVWPYADVMGFCAYMVGFTYAPPGLRDVPKSGFNRHLPQPVGFSNPRTGKPMAYATDVMSVEGWVPKDLRNDTSSNVDVGDYLFAKVRIGYTALPYAALPDSSMPLVSNAPSEVGLTRYVSRSVAPGSRHLTLPAGAFKWESSGETSTQTLGRMLGYVDVVYTWRQVPQLPAAVFTHIGSVNDSSWDNNPAGTMLLMGVEVTPKRMVTGDRSFDIAYKMRYVGNTDAAYPGQTLGHNYFLRFAGRDIAFRFDRPYAGPPSAKRYVFDTKDFELLFGGPFVTVPWTLM